MGKQYDHEDRDGDRLEITDGEDGALVVTVNSPETTERIGAFASVRVEADERKRAAAVFDPEAGGYIEALARAEQEIAELRIELARLRAAAAEVGPDEGMGWQAQAAVWLRGDEAQEAMRDAFGGERDSSADDEGAWEDVGLATSALVALLCPPTEAAPKGGTPEPWRAAVLHGHVPVQARTEPGGWVRVRHVEPKTHWLAWLVPRCDVRGEIEVGPTESLDDVVSHIHGAGTMLLRMVEEVGDWTYWARKHLDSKEHRDPKLREALDKRLAAAPSAPQGAGPASDAWRRMVVASDGGEYVYAGADGGAPLCASGCGEPVSEGTLSRNKPYHLVCWWAAEAARWKREAERLAAPSAPQGAAGEVSDYEVKP